MRYGFRTKTKFPWFKWWYSSSQLVALMGTSAAGKTELMDVLSGYTTKGVTEYIYINVKVHNPGNSLSVFYLLNY